MKWWISMGLMVATLAADCSLSSLADEIKTLHRNYVAMEQNLKAERLNLFYERLQEQLAILDVIEQEGAEDEGCIRLAVKHRTELKKSIEEQQNNSFFYAPRHVYEGEENMAFLQNVVRVVSYQKRQKNYCNGVLYSETDRADTVITAEHCLGNDMVVLQRSGDGFAKIPVESISYSNASADLAVLTLPKTLPARPLQLISQPIRPMTIGNNRFLGLLDSLENAQVVTAGYSMEKGVGKYGKYLTYQKHCQIGPVKALPQAWFSMSEEQFRTPPKTVSNSCYAESGSSGSAVFVITESHQVYLAGIVSEAVYDQERNFLHSAFSPYLYTLASVFE